MELYTTMQIQQHARAISIVKINFNAVSEFLHFTYISSQKSNSNIILVLIQCNKEKSCVTTYGCP